MFGEDVGGGSLTRRTWLGAAGAAWTGLLSRWAGGDVATGNERAKAKSVILIFNCGAPATSICGTLSPKRPILPGTVSGDLDGRARHPCSPSCCPTWRRG